MANYIQAPSAASVLVEISDNAGQIATASGFVVKHSNRYFLLTNRHVVTGLNQSNNTLLWRNVPDHLTFRGRIGNNLLTWYEVQYPLLNEDYSRRWLEHPTLGKRADFVAIPLPADMTQEGNPSPVAYDLLKPEPLITYRPTDMVSIVGFPFGTSLEGTAIWSAGFVASEPQLNYDDRPIFLVDSRTRSGQSGSPVIAHRLSGMVETEDGTVSMFVNPVTRLLGIYSGRINEHSDLGLVWKIAAVKELIDSCI